MLVQKRVLDASAHPHGLILSVCQYEPKQPAPTWPDTQAETRNVRYEYDQDGPTGDSSDLFAYESKGDRLERLEKEQQKQLGALGMGIGESPQGVLDESRLSGYTCDLCKKHGDGASYHCAACEFDAHPACLLKVKIDREGDMNWRVFIAQTKQDNELVPSQWDRSYNRGATLRRVCASDVDFMRVPSLRCQFAPKRMDTIKKVWEGSKQRTQTIAAIVQYAGISAAVANLICGYEEQHDVYILANPKPDAQPKWPLK